MYSQQLQDEVSRISRISNVNPTDVKLLHRSMAAYMSVLAKYLGGKLYPPSDIVSATTDALFLSNALSQMENSPEAASGHYLVGMVFEQSGELLFRKVQSTGAVEPLHNDLWYQLLLALLHYLAGGYRVQASSVLHELVDYSHKITDGEYRNEYLDATGELRRLLNGRIPTNLISKWQSILFGRPDLSDFQIAKIHRLAAMVQQRRLAALEDLGLGREEEWLRDQGIRNQNAWKFWSDYLKRLAFRGYTNFTNEQRGDGFSSWLRVDLDLLVVLPTGSGKTLLGELETALSLSIGQQVLWMLPTRALVRQAKHELRRAFEPIGVEVEELPVTEDFIPQMLETLPVGRYIAATTPEKIQALIRSNEEAIRNTGLVVLDEAQKLFDESRGTTIEHVLLEIHRIVPTCRFVLMSAQFDALDRMVEFFNRFRPGTPRSQLVSSIRPTRRINGVITDSIEGGYWYPSIEVYPPGIQNVNENTTTPYTIFLSNNKARAKPQQTRLAHQVVVELTKTPLRTVAFVDFPISTESQADSIAKKIRSTDIELPKEDIARLRIELGRESAIEQFGKKGIAPHHAALTPLEQHLVEKWIRNKTIRSIVATSTLAEGVNLPIDVSIVTYLRRHRRDGNQAVPINEIQNMLGRAGRAGHVSDGLCLITYPSSETQRRRPLDSARRYFFRQERIQDYLGLSKLLQNARTARVYENGWLQEYGGLKFSECQTLVSFILQANLSTENFEARLIENLDQYPSLSDFENTQQLLTFHIFPLANNLNSLLGDNPKLALAMERTGLPYEILVEYLRSMDQINRIRNWSFQDRLSWSDDIVRTAFEHVRSRQWFFDLLGEFDLDQMMSSIQRWRRGETLSEIENHGRLARNDRRNRIAVGKFINKRLSLIAQFWGGLAVCEKIVTGDSKNLALENIQVFTREGVSNMNELAWLNSLTNIDRVLAHRLARYTPEETESTSAQRTVKQTIRDWRSNHRLLPLDLEHDEVAALTSILDE